MPSCAEIVISGSPILSGTAQDQFRGILALGCTIALERTITPRSEDDAYVMFSEDGPVRIDVLQRLAEQAMSDAAFRDEARDDLPATLVKHGYHLTPQEMALVVRFRRSLADAGVDLDLVDGMSDERLTAVIDRLTRRARNEEPG